MINYDSILSAFDGKPTLLQWLKMVKKALDESVLKNVDITQNGNNIAFTFNFEDGTSIRTPEVTLPKGESGVGIVRIETTGSKVVGENTESTIRVELSDGSIKQFKTYAKNGSNGLNGNDGVSITGIDTVSNQVVGDETLTTLRARYSNDTTGDFVVSAKNGKDASGAANIYLHSVKIYDSGYSIFFNIYSKKDSLTLNDALDQIPNINMSNNFSSNKIPVAFSTGSKMGVVSVGKYIDYEKTYIRVDGIVFQSSGPTEYYNVSFNPMSINDTLLGVI